MVVSGPQRSGTTFAAKVVAAELGWTFLDETTFGIQNRQMWRRLLQHEQRSVVQCPAMMRHLHDDVPDDVLVVVMRRHVSDIVASQHRIGWEWERTELSRYGLKSGSISEVKYDWWDTHKMDGPARWVELDYDTLSGHPMWVAPEVRVTFSPKQTEVT